MESIFHRNGVDNVFKESIYCHLQSQLPANDGILRTFDQNNNWSYELHFKAKKFFLSFEVKMNDSLGLVQFWAFHS